MGIIRTKLSLANPKHSELAPIEVEALVDTGAMHLCVPEHIVHQLKLEELDQREITIADGSKRLVSYVGPLTAAFGNRRCFCGAMMLGREVLLGAIGMHDMDLVVEPLTRQVVPNPLNPDLPGSIAKGVCGRFDDQRGTAVAALR
jgi:clan AA aspartic protease